MKRTFVHVSEAGFLTPLQFDLDFRNLEKPAVLRAPLVFRSVDGAFYRVPAGYHSDLASIPRLVRGLIDRLERHAPAAVLHDYLYECQPVSRAQADALFVEAMTVMGVPRAKRAVMFWAVRAGGGRYWRRYRENAKDDKMQLMKGQARPLSAGTVERVARELLGCAPAALDAVLQVETPGFGFDPDGYLVCLPELHKVHRYLPAPLRRTARRKGLARARWSRKQYRGLSSYARNAHLAGKRRRALWAEIAALDERAAYLATSWGLGQIMGFNYRIAGYDSPQDMVRAFADSEDAQVEAMARFIINSGLDDELRELDWRGFARGYNGPGQVPHYARLLQRAFDQSEMDKADPSPASPPAGDTSDPVRLAAMRQGEMDSARVRELQNELVRLGYNVEADGDFGPETKFAVQHFQNDNGLKVDGLAGPKTLDALRDANGREPSNKSTAAIVKDDARVQAGMGQIAAAGATAAAVIADKASDPSVLSQAADQGQAVVGAVTPWMQIVKLVSGNLQMSLIMLLIAGGAWVVWRGVRAHRARRWW